MRDMLTTMMKGASTVGKIFGADVTYEESFEYTRIDFIEEGSF